MSMDLDTKEGAIILVTKTTAHNGYDMQQEDVAIHLKIGELYTLDNIEVGGFSSIVHLKEFPDKSFNSVSFINFVPKPNYQDYGEEMLSNPHGDETEWVVDRAKYKEDLRVWESENEDQIEAMLMFVEGKAKLSDSEKIVESIRAYNKECIGCLRNKKFAMISYKAEGEETIMDLFLDKDQAELVCDELMKALKLK